jgi:hypothetical protein
MRRRVARPGNSDARAVSGSMTRPAARVVSIFALTCLVGCERDRAVASASAREGDPREASREARDDDRPGFAQREEISGERGRSALPDIPCPRVQVISVVGFLLASLVPESTTAMAVDYRPNRLVWLLDALLVDHPRDEGGQCRFELRFTP